MINFCFLGVGKTAFIKSAAAGLNYKVIEINTSHARSQKSIISQFKDGSIAQKLSTADNDNKSLILVDDADVVLPEDSNFLQAICTLAQMSHKPVVLSVANEEALSNIRVSFKKFEIPCDRTKALCVLLKCICITKRIKIDDSVLSDLSSKNNFHHAINALQLGIENRIYQNTFNCSFKSNSLKEFLIETHSDILTRYGTKMASNLEDMEESTRNELELNSFSKALELKAFMETSHVSSFAATDCRVWPGDTANENSQLQFNFRPKPKVSTMEESDKIANLQSLCTKYFTHNSRTKDERFAHVYPYLGLLCQVNDENKTILEAKDHRKMKRHTHFVNSCNLDLSEDLKEWLPEFYRFPRN